MGRWTDLLMIAGAAAVTLLVAGFVYLKIVGG